jgi:hypothetical protein
VPSPVYKGFRQRFNAERDTPELPLDLDPDDLSSKAQALWAKEVAANPTAPRFFSGVLRPLIYIELMVAIFMGTLAGTANTVVRPLILRWIIVAIGELNRSDLAGDDEESTAILYRLGYLIGGMSLTLIVEGVTTTAARHQIADLIGSKFMSATASLIQQKVARVAINAIPADLQESGLLGNDCVRFTENCKHMANLPFCISSLIGGICVLIITIGRSSAVGLGVMALSILCNIRFAVLAKDAEEDNLAAADIRLGTMRQVRHYTKEQRDTYHATQNLKHTRSHINTHSNTQAHK